MGQIKKRKKKVHEQHPARGLLVADSCHIGMNGHVHDFFCNNNLIFFYKINHSLTNSIPQIIS